MKDKSLKTLVSGLEEEERTDLLKKVVGKPADEEQTGITLDKVAAADGKKFVRKNRNDSIREMSVKLRSEPWYRRIYFWLKSVFSNSTPTAVYCDYLIENIAIRIERKTPGLIDFKHGRFLTVMYNYLISLRDAALYFRPFIELIDSDIGLFYVFACRRVIPDFEKKYIREIDPQRLQADTKLDSHLRSSLIKKLEDMLNDMSDTNKNRLAELIQNFSMIRQIGVMPFKRFSAMFVRQGGQQICLFQEVRAEVSNIAKLVCSASIINDSLLDIMNDFFIEEEKKGLDVSQRPNFIEKGGMYFSSINAFLARVPMNLIGAVVYYDVDWLPPAPEALDNWFGLLKSRWRELFDESWDKIVLKHRGVEIAGKINEFFGTTFESAPLLPNRPWTIFAKVHFNDDYMLGFINMYFSTMYANFKENLNTLAVEGEFLKMENRVDFTESLSSIEDETQALAELKLRLVPESGEYAEILDRLKVQNTINKKKLEVTMRKINLTSTQIISRTIAALAVINSVLGGLFSEKRNPQYMGIANMQTVQGTNNADFIKGLAEADANITAALAVLREIGK